MNKYEIGTGSWYCNVSFNEYRDKMSFQEFRKFCYEKCKERFNNLGLQKGDKVRVTYIGGNNPRKYTGIVLGINSMCLWLQQNKNERSVDIIFIDEVELLESGSDIIN
ncbi:hypothetical protein BC01_147 [Bacillus phage BC01]|nr:hypothetical protein BC01_147 [Bacillus phage BC01]